VAVAEELLEAHEIYRFYHSGEEETFALRGVSMVAGRGELVAIVGPSGSGKSTLLACLAGLDEPDGGYVTVAGERITRRPEATRARLRATHIGMLLQSGNLLDHLSVAGNVRAAQRLGGGTSEDIPLLLGSVGLADRSHARPSRLSGGEAARAGLAVALANDPEVLLADEPTGEVDSANEKLILDLLHGRARRGKSVVVVTHSDRVACAADRVIHLSHGKVSDV
jgi:putative ABC transport system ATP-binding protein